MFSRGKKRQFDAIRQNSIKTKLIDELSESIKVIQLEDKNTDIALGLNEATSRLCTILEAIFIHGLKAPFLGRFPLWGGGESSPRLPEPAFWTFVLLYSHKQVINKIDKFSQITSEVGKARTWLRVALNDGLLVSYLTSMSRDGSSLGVHYEGYAILRDNDRMDLVRTYVTGLEMFHFSLPTNVSLLNRWMPDPLLLAGELENKVLAVTDTSCIDAAAQLDQQQCTPQSESQPRLIRSLAEPIYNNSLVQLGLLNEDEALRLILKSTPISLPSSPIPPFSSQYDAEVSESKYDNHHEEQQHNKELTSSFFSQTNIERRPLSPTIRNKKCSRAPSPALPLTASRNMSAERIYVSEGPVTMSSTQDDQSIGSVAEPDFGINMYCNETDMSTSNDLSKLEESPISDDNLDIYATYICKSQSQTSLKQAQSKSRSASPIQTKDILGSKSSQLESYTYTLSHTCSPKPSATPSMEWEEEFEELKHLPECLEIELQKAELRETSSEQNIKQFVSEHKTLSHQSHSVSSEGSDQSCCCSTQGPLLECQVCSTVQMEPRSGIQLSDFVEPDPASSDQISLEGERKRRRQAFKIGFRKLPDLSIPELSLQRNLDMVSCLDIIPRELGLHTQDWRCIDCTKAIGALFGNGKVCTFTKKYYCEDCHEDDLLIIPSRLLYNWDGKQYPVAKSSFRFLQAARVFPIMKIREFNAKLLEFVPSIEKIMKSRKKLHYMHAYIIACKKAIEEDVGTRLYNLLGGRDYLCTETEIFSLLDLEEIHGGQMDQVIKIGIDMCSKHIDACLVCSGRGFICEICKDKTPVYPFNLESTSQCEDCFTVFHSSCAQSLLQCPRCERISSRALNSLITEAKLTRELRQKL